MNGGGSIKILSADLNRYLPFKTTVVARVDLEDEENLQKWGLALRLSREALLAAVEEFGPLVRDIRQGLDKKAIS